MINEAKVKQLYKVARCEQEEEKSYQQINKYYCNDYIAKELLKSIFTGTMAYLFMSTLWIAGNWWNVLTQINQNRLEKVWIPLVCIYVIYMIIYLVITYILYKSKYKEYVERAKEYEMELMHLDELYEQEE